MLRFMAAIGIAGRLCAPAGAASQWAGICGSALGGTKIAINLVRRANRDGHVMRSFEIPACGALMLAEKTREHSELFADGINAAFFQTVPDLARQIKHYLARPGERESIKQAGLALVSSEGHEYRSRLLSILAAAGGRTPTTRRPITLIAYVNAAVSVEDASLGEPCRPQVP